VTSGSCSRSRTTATRPFADASFDQAISNGAFNLVVDKDAALRELARVLAPGGWLAFADLLVTGDAPEQRIADKGAWSA
jgi:ubiquinone/menaquinone biosynthesis C-methylase UbiE